MDRHFLQLLLFLLLTTILHVLVRDARGDGVVVAKRRGGVGVSSVSNDDDDCCCCCCMAKNLHLAPGSSVRVVDDNKNMMVVDMYVSFTLDYYYYYNSPPCDCGCSSSKMMNVGIAYGDNNNNNSSNTSNATTVLLLSQPIQFASYEHAWSREPHQSSYIYHGLLENLTASSDYWYQIIQQQQEQQVDVTVATTDDDVNATSSIRNLSARISFVTPTALGQPTTLAIVGDWGQSDNALRTMERIRNATTRMADWHSQQHHQQQQQHLLLRSHKRHDASIHSAHPRPPPPVSTLLVVGDLSYANGHLPSWETWLTQMQPLFETTPMLIAAGNHELECDAKTYQIFQAYEYYFRTPHYRPPTDWRPVPYAKRLQGCTHTAAELWSVYEGGNSYYDYRQGLVHIIVLNSYTPSQVGSPQYQWLRRVLEQRVDRTVTPWLIVAFHCPFYTTFRGHNNEVNPQEMRQAMEPLFLQHQVNMVFSGHQHAYVRSHPLPQQQQQQQNNNNNNNHGKMDAANNGGGIVYFTVGTGGDSHSQGPLRPHQPEEWVAARDHTTFGAGRLQLVNATHAYWERLLWSSSMTEDDDDDDESAATTTTTTTTAADETLLQRIKDPVWIINSLHYNHNNNNNSTTQDQQQTMKETVVNGTVAVE
jgi:acid phosphatase type 7